ncbi:hypothetical protein [Actinophytocola glycyrrhizae]|uniref:DUF4828 domain-containing protein n=1 Tax=Actinophytocola glycyrrhizae TaxID=2044873 RepID=A0ABV9RXG5_9PSEU
MATTVVIGLGSVLACAPNEPSVERDSVLEQQLMSIQEGGEQQRLHDLVAGDWSTVHIFDMESVVRDYVEERVGHSIDMSDHFLTEGMLLVFVNDEEVVRGATVYDVRFMLDYQTGDVEAVVEHDTTTGYLKLK